MHHMVGNSMLIIRYIDYMVQCESRMPSGNCRCHPTDRDNVAVHMCLHFDLASHLGLMHSLTIQVRHSGN